MNENIDWRTKVSTAKSVKGDWRSLNSEEKKSIWRRANRKGLAKKRLDKLVEVMAKMEVRFDQTFGRKQNGHTVSGNFTVCLLAEPADGGWEFYSGATKRNPSDRHNEATAHGYSFQAAVNQFLAGW